MPRVNDDRFQSEPAAPARMVSWRTIAGAALAFLIFEVLLRQLVAGHVVLDPRLGWLWRSTTVVQRLREGWGVSHWRDDATRSHAPVAAASPRVLVIGDSFTEALQVDDDEVFSANLANVNALNIGQSGHSAADYVTFAPEYRTRFKPAWTIIELAPPDLADDAFTRSKTHFTPGLDVQVIIMPGYAGRLSFLLTPLRRHSDVADYALTRLHDYRTDGELPPLFRAADYETPPKTPPVSSAVWPVHDEIARLVSAYEGRITFLMVPDFKGEPTGTEAAFLQTCRADKLSCVDLRSVFDDFRARGDAPSGFPNSTFGEGHLNARGHAAAAALLNAELERLRGRGLF